MKLSTIHYQYMGELHAKLYQNWWSGFRDIRGQNTDGHSFIIIWIMVQVAKLDLEISALLTNW